MKRTLLLNHMVKPYTRIGGMTVVIAAAILLVLILNNNHRTNEFNNYTLINQPLVQLDNYLSDMDTLAQNAMINELLIKRFSDLREDSGADNHFAKNVLDAIETSSILHNITGVRSDIFRISAYNNLGDFISSGAVVDSHEARDYMLTSEVDVKMQEFATGNRDYFLLPPSLDHWSTAYKSDYLSLIRPIMNNYSRDVVGVVEIQKNKETLISSVYLSENSGKKINIYNETGEAILFQPDTENYRVVASVTSNLYGWKIDLLETKSALWFRLIQIFLSVIGGSIAIVFFVRYIVGRITRKIVFPLETLQKSVESIDVTAPTRIDITDLDIEEVYSVANSFNTLMEKVTFLMEQEKKAYLFALQAQMNPHFLYNALSIINAAAISGRGETVVEIVGNLSGMLRYTSSFENNVTTLTEEVRHAEQYLMLMKARYAELFTYQIEMEDSLKDEIVPKLVIQPLCENCFQHGFADIEPPYRIQVWIRAEKNGWSVEVLDNGRGFSVEERAALISKVETVDYTDLDSLQLGGLGILSSIVRTRIVSGKIVTCEIKSLSPKGSFVKINILNKGDINATE